MPIPQIMKTIVEVVECVPSSGFLFFWAAMRARISARSQPVVSLLFMTHSSRTLISSHLISPLTCCAKQFFSLDGGPCALPCVSMVEQQRFCQICALFRFTSRCSEDPLSVTEEQRSTRAENMAHLRACRTRHRRGVVRAHLLRPPRLSAGSGQWKFRNAGLK